MILNAVDDDKVSIMWFSFHLFIIINPHYHIHHLTFKTFIFQHFRASKTLKASTQFT